MTGQGCKSRKASYVRWNVRQNADYARLRVASTIVSGDTKT